MLSMMRNGGNASFHPFGWERAIAENKAGRTARKRNLRMMIDSTASLSFGFFHRHAKEPARLPEPPVWILGGCFKAYGSRRDLSLGRRPWSSGRPSADTRRAALSPF